MPEITASGAEIIKFAKRTCGTCAGAGWFMVTRIEQTVLKRTRELCQCAVRRYVRNVNANL